MCCVLILDFPSLPELWETKGIYKAQSLWYFIIAAPMDWGKQQQDHEQGGMQGLPASDRVVWTSAPVGTSHSPVNKAYPWSSGVEKGLDSLFLVAGQGCEGE